MHSTWQVGRRSLHQYAVAFASPEDFEAVDDSIWGWNESMNGLVYIQHILIETAWTDLTNLCWHVHIELCESELSELQN